MRTSTIGLALAIVSTLASPLAAQESVEDKLKSSVVRIGNDESSGTGMFLDADGLILTNAHVACSPLPFRVQATSKVDGKPKEVLFSKVTLLGFHPSYDLALLRIDPTETGAMVKPVTVARAPPVSGERVWAIGFPGDYERGKLKVATWGEMRSTSKDFYGLPYFEMDISVWHGNSGGPLCNNQGEVIGVVTAMAPNGRALAVPIAAMKPEKFGPLKDRHPNVEVSSHFLDLAEQQLKTDGPSSQVMHLFETALLWDSGNAGLYSKVGQLNLSGSRFPSAVAYLTRSLQMQPWPEKTETYRSLGLALVNLRKVDDALTVFREGLEKYPLDSAELWGDIATMLDKQKLPVEAAYSARVALKTFSGHAGEMNELYRRSQASLSPPDAARLRDMELDLDQHLGRLRAAADKARRDGKAFINAEAERVIATMTGVQKETPGAKVARIEAEKPPTRIMSDQELDIRFIRGRIDVAKEHVRSGNVDRGVEILEDIIRTYPANPETEAARLALKIFKRS